MQWPVLAFIQSGSFLNSESAGVDDSNFQDEHPNLRVVCSHHDSAGASIPNFPTSLMNVVGSTRIYSIGLLEDGWDTQLS